MKKLVKTGKHNSWPTKPSGRSKKRDCSCSPVGSNIKGKFGGTAAKLHKAAHSGLKEVKV